MRSFRRTLRRAICFELGGFIVFRRSGDLPSPRSPIEHFRQPCEIDRNLSRVADRQEAGMSCHVRVGPAIEKAELPASGVIDGKSIWEFGDPPRPGKAAGHVEILRSRKPQRTDDHAEVDLRSVPIVTAALDGCCRGARGQPSGTAVTIASQAPPLEAPSVL